MLTLIVGKDYIQGRDWLRENYTKRKLDPQQCRIVTRGDILRGLTTFHVIWLPGWSDGANAREIHHVFLGCVRPGRSITEERVEECH